MMVTAFRWIGRRFHPLQFLFSHRKPILRHVDSTRLTSEPALAADIPPARPKLLSHRRRKLELRHPSLMSAARVRICVCSGTSIQRPDNNNNNHVLHSPPIKELMAGVFACGPFSAVQDRRRRCSCALYKMLLHG